MSSGLFQLGEFTLHSGGTSPWKLDCSSLSDAELEALAAMAADRVPRFGSVEGIPSGGLRFAEAMAKHATEGPLLLVDDVLTTGRSMQTQRGSRDAWGVVIFSRISAHLVPHWIMPLFAVVS